MGGVKRGVSQKAKFLGLAPILVDDVARVHAGAKGKADGRARVVVARHAVRAVLVDTCAAFSIPSLRSTRNKSCSIWRKRSRLSNSEGAGMFCGIYFVLIT